MDSLRNSIGLRAYGQRDPLIEYKAEAFKIFDELMVNIKTEICHNIFRSASSLMAFENFLRKLPQRTLHSEASAFGGKHPGAEPAPAPGDRARAAALVAKDRGSSRPNPFAPARRSAATIPAPAAAARSTSTAAVAEIRRSVLSANQSARQRDSQCHPRLVRHAGR